MKYFLPLSLLAVLIYTLVSIMDVPPVQAIVDTEAQLRTTTSTFYITPVTQ